MVIMSQALRVFTDSSPRHPSPQQHGAHPHHARQAGGSPPDSRRELASERSAPRQHHAAHRLPPPPHRLLESQPDTAFLGQLKTLLTGPELPVAGGVAVPWDIAYFIEFLKPKLGGHNADFLSALIAAMNDRTTSSALNSFPEWREQPPVLLDAPWPST